MKVAVIVDRVLERNPAARDSDKVLFLEVWEELGFYLSESQRIKFMNLPSTETIHRIRRKLQEQGKHQGSESVKKTRRLKSLVVQQNLPKASLETTERVLEQVPTFSKQSLI